MCVFFADNRVLIVIGGDDNYKNEDEEGREFISRWARRKISSQFGEEFLDGRKGFVFSWDKKHREIHKKALVHFLSKKGQKFENHPPQQQVVTKPTPPSQREVDLSKTSWPYHSVLERQSSTKATDFSCYGQSDQSSKTGGISGADIGSQGAGPQRAVGSTMVPNTLNSPQEMFSSIGETQIPFREKGTGFSAGGTGRPDIQSQGARPKETTSFTRQPQKTNGGEQILHSADLQPLSLM